MFPALGITGNLPPVPGAPHARSCLESDCESWAHRGRWDLPSLVDPPACEVPSCLAWWGTISTLLWARALGCRQLTATMSQATAKCFTLVHQNKKSSSSFSFSWRKHTNRTRCFLKTWGPGHGHRHSSMVCVVSGCCAGVGH